jgi:tryptophanyl-tRNA synthetase
MARPVLLSGIQPTGSLMIGNYTGALRSWVRMQDSHDALFMVADLHALTVPQQRGELRRRSLEVAALFLACGVDPMRSSVFLQSRVPGHTQLMWVLSCAVALGELQRMTQFKEKSIRHPKAVNAGLFTYPVLMAADILLYGAEQVPVGADQAQHIEFARRVARAFNSAYGDVFKVPEMVAPPAGARLMALQDPAAKMSKSERSSENAIALLDPPDEIRRKLRMALTDSGSEVRCAAEKPGLCNLMNLMEAVTGLDHESIAGRYAGKGYAEFKRDLVELTVEFLRPIRERYAALAANPTGLEAVLQRGAEDAVRRSRETLKCVFEAVGLRGFKCDSEPMVAALRGAGRPRAGAG